MLNSGSPRYKRLWGEHLESRLLPKSIGICVSSPHPQALISGCGGHNSRCGYPPPNSLTLGRLLCYLSQQLGLGDCSPCLLPALPAPPPRTGVQLILPLLRRRGAHVMVQHLPPVLTLAP